MLSYCIMLFSYAVFCGSICIFSIVGAGSYPSTTIGIIDSMTGEGMKSTSTNPSSFIQFFTPIVGSYGDLMVLHIFLVVLLGAPTFGGAILLEYMSVFSDISLIDSCSLLDSYSLALCFLKVTMWLVGHDFFFYSVVINDPNPTGYASSTVINICFMPHFLDGWVFLFLTIFFSGV
jgi:hypothetical protein